MWLPIYFYNGRYSTCCLTAHFNNYFVPSFCRRSHKHSSKLCNKFEEQNMKQSACIMWSSHDILAQHIALVLGCICRELWALGMQSQIYSSLVIFGENLHIIPTHVVEAKKKRKEKEKEVISSIGCILGWVFCYHFDLFYLNMPS